MKKNEIYDVLIKEIDNNGNGIAKIGNFVIFINGVKKDEQVKIKIIDVKKHFAIAKALDKDNNICPYFYSCGGCSFLHVSYDEELKCKKSMLDNLFSNIKINDIISKNELNYRNKVTLHVVNGEIGLFEENTNNIIKIDKCVLLDDEINNYISILKKIDLTSVNKIIIKKTYYTKQIMIAFYGDIDLKELNKLDRVNSIYLNDKLITGSLSIEEKIDDKRFIIGIESFFQVNTICMERMYNKIKEYAGIGDSLLDLYCGTGTIGIYLSDNYKKVLGIEQVKEAIDNAKENKKINHLHNIEFICSDAGIIKNKKYDCIVVDPPRNGLTKKVINNILNSSAKKLIYISCNPSTLKNDLELIKDKYDAIEMTPFNMFPKTKHIETVTLLTRKIINNEK